jgi:hypothetical protein
VNNGTSSVALSSLTLRYYFTADGCTSEAFSCDYALLGCGLLTSSFAATTGTNADHYLEVGFTAAAGSLAAGGNTGEIQARFHDSNNFQTTFTQTNDYSYDATKTAFAAWSKVTLFENGTLVWGQEP